MALDKLSSKNKSLGIGWHVHKKMHRLTNGRFPLPENDPPRIKSNEELQKRLKGAPEGGVVRLVKGHHKPKYPAKKPAKFPLSRKATGHDRPIYFDSDLIYSKAFHDLNNSGKLLLAHFYTKRTSRKVPINGKKNGCSRIWMNLYSLMAMGSKGE